MKTIRLIALMGITVFAAAQAHAERPYGAAGCGLGSLWMGKNHQVMAATTNGTAYNQLFAISFGTSNCTDSASNSAANMRIYVEANKLALANDIARGNGDTVVNLAQIAGCKDSGIFAASLQKNYSRIYPNQAVGANDVSQSIITTIHSDAALASSCNLTI